MKQQREQDGGFSQQSQKLAVIGQLTRGITHDFDNLLGIILGHNGLIMRILKSGGEVDKDAILNKAQVIEIASRRAAALVKSLKTFSRQGYLGAEVVDVNVCINETHEMLHSILGGTGEIKIVPAAAIWPVRIDPGQFKNALIGMALNASEVMPKGGRLTIETHNVPLDDKQASLYPDIGPGNYVVVVVSDAGTGMSDDIAWRISGPSFMAENTAAETSLGLSLLYDFIRQSSGHLYCRGAEGHCISYKLYLPRMEVEDITR